MVTRRLALGLGLLVGVAAAGGAASLGYDRAMAEARAKVAEYPSQVIKSRFGDLEYAVKGNGTPLLMIHGTGGGFDQGLFFARRLLDKGYRVIAPSRFGYLRSAFPADPSSENQADAFVDLLDALEIDRIAVAGGSAGALSAMAFAIRHPERCAALLPIVPAAYAPSHPSAEPMTPTQWWIAERALRSDFLFWLGLTTQTDAMIGSLLATDPVLVKAASAAEQSRVHDILWRILPVSARAKGLVNDARLAGNPAKLELDKITAPTLTISVEDDRFGTADAARYIAATVPGARLILYPQGGHVFVGHEEELFAAIDGFLHSTGYA